MAWLQNTAKIALIGSIAYCCRAKASEGESDSHDDPPLPERTRNGSTSGMSRRLVEVLEFGWDLALRCTACGHREVRSKPHFLGAWRKYLNADIHEMAKRMTCPACKAKSIEASERGGQYAYFGMASETVQGRAILIRKTLTNAGLDPAAYGYPPFETPPKVTHEPR